MMNDDNPQQVMKYAERPNATFYANNHMQKLGIESVFALVGLKGGCRPGSAAGGHLLGERFYYRTSILRRYIRKGHKAEVTLMKITSSGFHSPVTIKQERCDLIEGNVPKLAAKQVDDVDDVNFKEPKAHHRISFQYNQELGKNIAHVIDNSTGKTVKHLPSATQVDHAIRLKRLMGLHVDKKG